MNIDAFKKDTQFYINKIQLHLFKLAMQYLKRKCLCDSKAVQDIYGIVIPYKILNYTLCESIKKITILNYKQLLLSKSPPPVRILENSIDILSLISNKKECVIYSFFNTIRVL